MKAHPVDLVKQRRVRRSADVQIQFEVGCRRRYLLVVACMLGCVRPAAAQEIVIVSPNNYATSPGNCPTGPGTLRDPYHYQEVLAAGDFSALPDGRGLLTQMAYRPSHLVTQPLTAPLGQTVVRFSTTDKAPNDFSLTFADNVGPDETTVFDGSLTFHTENVGPPEGPKEFDYVIDLQTPFYYDAANGNLLLDVRVFDGTGVDQDGAIDGACGIGHNRLLFAKGADATVGTHGNESGALTVMQFTFLPALPGDFDHDGDRDGFDLVKWQRGGSPDPLSQADLVAWASHFGSNVNPTAGFFTEAPEPSTALLLTVAATTIAFRRRVNGESQST